MPAVVGAKRQRGGDMEHCGDAVISLRRAPRKLEAHGPPADCLSVVK